MGAALDDAPGVEHEDLVGVTDRREPVGNRDRRAPARDRRVRAARRARSRCRAPRWPRRARAPVGCAAPCGRSRCAASPRRRSDRALAHGRVVAIGQRGDQLVDLRRARGVFDLLVAGVRTGEAQVLADRGVEQVRFLGQTSPTVAASDSWVRSRISTPSMLTQPRWLVQPCDQICECRLARPGLTHERRACPRRDLRRDLLRASTASQSRGRSETTRRPSARRRALRSRCARRGAPRCCRRAESRVPSKMRPNSASEVWTSRPTDSSSPHREQEARLQRRERDDGADRDHVLAVDDRGSPRTSRPRRA